MQDRLIAAIAALIIVRSLIALPLHAGHFAHALATQNNTLYLSHGLAVLALFLVVLIAGRVLSRRIEHLNAHL